MPDLDYAKVTGRLALTVGDTADTGEDPDTIWCDEGTVRIKPLNTYTKVAGGSPVPFTAGHAVIDCTVDSEGYLTYLGQRQVYVVDLTSPKVNPQIGAGLATHEVSFLDVKANGTPVSFEKMEVRLTKLGANGDGENDITIVSPVPSGSATPIIVGPQGTGIQSLAVEGGDLVVALSDGSEVNAGALPVGPGGSDAGVAGYVLTPGSDTEAAISAAIVGTNEATVARSAATESGATVADQITSSSTALPTGEHAVLFVPSALREPGVNSPPPATDIVVTDKVTLVDMRDDHALTTNAAQKSGFHLFRLFGADVVSPAVGGSDNGSTAAFEALLTEGTGSNGYGSDPLVHGENCALYAGTQRQVGSTRSGWAANLVMTSYEPVDEGHSTYGLEIDLSNNGGTDATQDTPFDGISLFAAGTNDSRFGLWVANSGTAKWLKGIVVSDRVESVGVEVASGIPLGIHNMSPTRLEGDLTFAAGSKIVYEGADSNGTKTARAQRTSGDVVINSPTFVDVDTALDLTLAAKAGDVIEIEPQIKAFKTVAGSTYVVVDFHTIVGGSLVNSVTSASAAGTGLANSMPGWGSGTLQPNADATPPPVIGGARQYVVQPGDISGGNVTFRLRAFSGDSVTLVAADPMLYVSAKNLRQ